MRFCTHLLTKNWEWRNFDVESSTGNKTNVFEKYRFWRCVLHLHSHQSDEIFNSWKHKKRRVTDQVWNYGKFCFISANNSYRSNNLKDFYHQTKPLILFSSQEYEIWSDWCEWRCKTHLQNLNFSKILVLLPAELSVSKLCNSRFLVGKCVQKGIIPRRNFWRQQN